MAGLSSSGSGRCVELGFLEKCEPWTIKSKYFPSKVGGKPAWLSLENIPRLDRVACRNCGEPCIFLLQVYAPREEIDEAFHRTLLLFTCVAPKCVASHAEGSFIALRSQLPRVNSFYSKDPPKRVREGSNSPSASDFNPLCDVCGVLGDKKCGQCKSRRYCSKSHQVTDWKSGHKAVCGTNSPNGDVVSRIMYPEFELVTEPDEESDDDVKDENERLDAYNDFLSKHPECRVSPGDPENTRDLQSMAATCTDKAFWKFKKKMRKAPEQVLRYQLGGNPLWVSSEGLPKDMPHCECGAQRQFELQVMPQLLNSIVGSNPDGVDWGTLVVYTCKTSCSVGTTYREEYVWKQDFSNKE